MRGALVRSSWDRNDTVIIASADFGTAPPRTESPRVEGMEPELLQRLRRMGMELEHLRSRLAELAVLQQHLHARQYAELPNDAPGLPVAVENGLEEFLRAYV